MCGFASFLSLLLINNSLILLVGLLRNFFTSQFLTLFYTQVLRQSVVIKFYSRPFRYSVVPRLSHASLFWSAAGGGETGRQNWANLQALLGRGQERQRGTVVRGLLVSHAQGDPPASQLGLQIPTIPCVTPLLPGFTLTLFGGEKKRFIFF